MRRKKALFTGKIPGDHNLRLAAAEGDRRGCLRAWYDLSPMLSGQVSPGRVADYLGESRETVRGRMNWLIENGYLELVAKVPGGASKLRITRRGRNFIR